MNSDIARLRDWTEAAEETVCRKPHKHWHIERQSEIADELPTIWSPQLLLAALDVIEAAEDYLVKHGHWPHDSECAHSLAHEAGHYEGEFMKDRHWAYDDSVKCDCAEGALSQSVVRWERLTDGQSS